MFDPWRGVYIAGVTYSLTLDPDMPQLSRKVVGEQSEFVAAFSGAWAPLEVLIAACEDRIKLARERGI